MSGPHDDLHPKRNRGKRPYQFELTCAKCGGITRIREDRDEEDGPPDTDFRFICPNCSDIRVRPDR